MVTGGAVREEIVAVVVGRLAVGFSLVKNGESGGFGLGLWDHWWFKFINGEHVVRSRREGG